MNRRFLFSIFTLINISKCFAIDDDDEPFTLIDKEPFTFTDDTFILIRSFFDVITIEDYVIATADNVMISEGLTENLAIWRPEGRRLFDVYVPPNLSANPALIVDIHTLNDNRKTAFQVSGFKEVADKTGEFIILYPQGVWTSWNGGICCARSTIIDIDDVGFMTELLVTLAELVEFDPNRIYAYGYSAGGAIVHRLAYERSDLFAAVTVNAYQMDEWMYDDAKRLEEEGQSRSPVSILTIHGTNDTSICWEDECYQRWIAYFEFFRFFLERFWVGEFKFHGANRGAGRWAELNNCASNFTDIDDISYSEELDIVWIKGYDNCDGGVEVIQILNSRVHSCENDSGARSGFINMWNYVEIHWNFMKRFSKNITTPLALRYPIS